MYTCVANIKLYIYIYICICICIYVYVCIYIYIYIYGCLTPPCRRRGVQAAAEEGAPRGRHPPGQEGRVI